MRIVFLALIASALIGSASITAHPVIDHSISDNCPQTLNVFPDPCNPDSNN